MKAVRLLIGAAFAAAFLAPTMQANAKPPGATTIRPIEDFVERQGTFCITIGAGGLEDGGYQDQIVDGNFVGTCDTGVAPLLFVPPIANFLGGSDPDQQWAVSVDYAGLADYWSGGALGTNFAGSVIERPLADGRALVKVLLRTGNALTWVVEGFDFNGPLLFGNRAPEVVDEGAEPALGAVSYQIEIINTAPGDPLPDLLQLLVFPEEGQEMLSMHVTNRAKGPLTELFGVPDGTPGLNTGNQVGLQSNPNCDDPDSPSAVADCFPVEKIKLRVIGQ